MGLEISYPFVIGNKVIKVTAPTLSNALDRITSRHQNKFITITHAKNMDLISAKVEAAKQSRTEHRKVYIIVDSDGECSLNHAPLKGVYACYNNGSEIALENDAPVTTTVPRPNKKKLPVQSEKAQALIAKKTEKESAESDSTTKTKNKVATPKKKATKKVAAKKQAPAKKVAGKIEGEKKELTIKAIIDLMNKDVRVYRQSTGGKLSIVHMKAAKNKDAKLAVTVAK